VPVAVGLNVIARCSSSRGERQTGAAVAHLREVERVPPRVAALLMTTARCRVRDRDRLRRARRADRLSAKVSDVGVNVTAGAPAAAAPPPPAATTRAVNAAKTKNALRTR